MSRHIFKHLDTDLLIVPKSITDRVFYKRLKKHADRRLVEIVTIFDMHLDNKVIPHLLKGNIFLYDLQLHPQRRLTAFFAQIIRKKLL